MRYYGPRWFNQFWQDSVKPLYRGLQVAWHKNRDEIGACAKFGGNFELKFCACADFVAIFVPSNLQSSVDTTTDHITPFCACARGVIPQNNNPSNNNLTLLVTITLAGYFLGEACMSMDSITGPVKAQRFCKECHFISKCIFEFW